MAQYMNDRIPEYPGFTPNQQAEPDMFRRRLLAAFSILPLLGNYALAQDTVDLEWSDLLPEGNNAVPQVLRGLIEHENAPLSSQQPASSGVRTDWNGKGARIHCPP